MKGMTRTPVYHNNNTILLFSNRELQCSIRPESPRPKCKKQSPDIEPTTEIQLLQIIQVPAYTSNRLCCNFYYGATGCALFCGGKYCYLLLPVRSTGTGSGSLCSKSCGNQFYDTVLLYDSRLNTVSKTVD
jgi:hypothetical protein